MNIITEEQIGLLFDQERLKDVKYSSSKALPILPDQKDTKLYVEDD